MLDITKIQTQVCLLLNYKVQLIIMAFTECVHKIIIQQIWGKKNKEINKYELKINDLEKRKNKYMSDFPKQTIKYTNLSKV